MEKIEEMRKLMSKSKAESKLNKRISISTIVYLIIVFGGTAVATVYTFMVITK